MKITFKSAQVESTGLACVPVFDDLVRKGVSKTFDLDFEKTSQAADFKGKPGQSFHVYAVPKSDAAQTLFIGAGKKAEFDSEMFAAKMTKAQLLSRQTNWTLYLDGMDIDPDSAARAAAGAQLASYRFDQYRTKLASTKKPAVQNLTIICDDPKMAQKSYDNYHGAEVQGVFLARDVVNEPPNVIYPVAYAQRIKKMEALGVKVTILGEAEMTKLGMHTLLGVGRGSVRESQLVIMQWNGGKEGEAPVALVGKGVTFDTGGISLKPGAGMWDMKGDMGGSAAVVGTMHTLAARKAKANVVGVVGLVENMPDGDAQLPGDIITSYSGQTVEVQNTDAEGRLVLADALWYTKEEYKPKAMVNLATLTGAIIVALGHEHAGLFSNNDNVAEQLLSAGETSTDKVWRLPLGKAYDRLLDSPNADMKNIGGRAAGSITAAQFLQRFVGDTPWAHLDIAGTGMKNTRHDPRETTFGTGFGVRLLNRWISDNYEG